MKPSSWEKVHRADRQVTRCKGGLRVAMEGLKPSQKDAIRRAAESLGTAIASLCIEVERVAEGEDWHEGEM